MLQSLTALANISIFLASLVVLYLIFRVLERMLNKKSITNGNGNSNKAGDRSIEEWEGRMNKLHQESEERLMVDIRNLMDIRLAEKVTNPIVAEIRGLRNDLTNRARRA